LNERDNRIAGALARNLVEGLREFEGIAPGKEFEW
jgi:hypothetical protein